MRTADPQTEEAWHAVWATELADRRRMARLQRLEREGTVECVPFRGGTRWQLTRRSGR